MSTKIDEMFQQALPSLIPVLKATFEAGFANGFQTGRALGFVEGVNALTPAVSDGLRHGSGVCGSAMQSLKNLGLDTGDGVENGEDDEDDEDEGGTIIA